MGLRSAVSKRSGAQIRNERAKFSLRTEQLTVERAEDTLAVDEKHALKILSVMNIREFMRSDPGAAGLCMTTARGGPLVYVKQRQGDEITFASARRTSCERRDAA
jgi:hypothetical protein